MPERAFDYDALRLLVRENPELTDSKLAELLSTNPNTVASVLRRYRKRWGIGPRHKTKYREYLPPDGTIALKHSNDLLVRNLRELGKEERGIDPPDGDVRRISERRAALKFSDRTIQYGRIVDVSEDGQLIVRRATGAEKDAQGKSLALCAWQLPGWGE